MRRTGTGDGLSINILEVVNLVLGEGEEGNVAQERNEREEGCEEREERGDQGECDVHREGEEKRDESDRGSCRVLSASKPS